MGKFHSSKAERMQKMKRAASGVWSTAHAQREQSRKYAEFEALPVQEQEAFRSAFAVYENIAGSAMLDANHIRSCLAELGLQGNTDSEKRALWNLLCETVAAGHFDLVTFAL